MPAGGMWRMLMPYTVATGVNDVLRAEQGGVQVNITIPAGTYYMSGDSADAADLATTLTTLLEAGWAGANAWAVTVLATGRLHFHCNAAFTIHANHANTTLDCDILGISNAGTLVGVLGGGVYDADTLRQSSILYNPEVIMLNDTRERPKYGIKLNETAAGNWRQEMWRPRVLLRDIESDLVAARKVFTADEVVVNEAFDRAFVRLSSGIDIRIWDDTAGAYPADWSEVTYRIRKEDWLSEFPPRLSDVQVMYSLALPLQRKP